MKRIGLTLAALTMAGVIGVSATAKGEDGVLLKEEASGGSYCHMKFPAIQESTLLTDHPQLKSADSGDIVDYYGPCDHDPLGKDEVNNQINDPVRGVRGEYRWW
jgi:hypothetical protein